MYDDININAFYNFYALYAYNKTGQLTSFSGYLSSDGQYLYYNAYGKVSRITESGIAKKGIKQAFAMPGNKEEVNN